MKTLLTILAFSILCSCSNKINENAITTLPEKSAQNILLSSIVEHIRFIPLASEPPEAIVNDRFGVKVMISENYICVVQTDPGNMVHIFSYPDGKFIHRHNRIGRGPGEYTYISDVDVYKDTLYILSFNTILAYTLDGKFIAEYNIGMRAIRFRVIDQNSFLLISHILSSEVANTEKQRLYIVNTQGEILHSLLDPKQSLQFDRPIDPMKFDHNTFLYQLGRSNDFISYNIKEQSFKNERLVSQDILSHEEEEKHLVQQGLNQFGLNDLSTLKALHISRMAVTNNDLFFTIRDSRQEVSQTHYIMSKNGGKIRYAVKEPYINDISFTERPPLLNLISNGFSERYFVSYMSPYQLINGIENYKSDTYPPHYYQMMDTLVKNLKEDDNLVLVEFSFK